MSPPKIKVRRSASRRKKISRLRVLNKDLTTYRLKPSGRSKSLSKSAREGKRKRKIDGVKGQTPRRAVI